MFTPAKTANYEGLIAHAGHQAMLGRALFEGPVLVELDIALSIPQSMSKKRKSLALAGGLYPTKKPDMDNVIKAIYDGLNGVVWKDDVHGREGGGGEALRRNARRASESRPSPRGRAVTTGNYRGESK